mgnify:CR=1 FL=1
MSADKALRMARNKGFGIEVKAILAEKGMTFNELRAKMYPPDSQNIKPSSYQMVDLMRGTNRARTGTLEKWAEALSVPTDRLLRAYDLFDTTTKEKTVPRVKPGVVKQILAVDAPTETVTHALSIVTQPDGTASLTINLHSLTILDALEIGRVVMERWP